jgi:hypothetical protein
VNNPKPNQPNELDSAISDKEMEAKIDAMLDPRYPDKPPAPEPLRVKISDTPQVVEDLPEIDIFKDAKSAPEITTLKDGAEADDTHTVAVNVQPKVADKPASASQSVVVGNPNEKSHKPTPKPLPKKPVAEPPAKHADQPKARKKSGLRRFFGGWWGNRWARYGTIIILIAAVSGLLAWPTSRYLLLNTAGVRSTASLRAVDEATGLPLKDVSVTLGSSRARTNEQGMVQFSDLKLGPQELRVARVAFAPINKQITLGWGSNPLGDQKLEATGAQYRFEIRDYLSGKPIEGAEASSAESSAYADVKGKILLTLEDPGEASTVDVTITANGYRTDKISLAITATKTTQVEMVSEQPVVYVSKESGTYDVFRMDADGKNQKMLVAGTGIERDNISLLMGPTGTYAALVSSREEKRDSDGYLLETLTLINIANGETQSLDHAQSIQIVEWRGTKLVYRATYSESSADENERQRIVAYDVEDSARNVLAKASYFSGIVGLYGYIYYVSTIPDESEGVFERIRLDGTGKRTLHEERSWTVVRTGAKAVHIQAEDGWLAYDTTLARIQKTAEPTNYQNRAFTTSPAGTSTAWVDTRDGRNVLLVRSGDSEQDKTIATASGISGPIQWLGAKTLSYYADTSDGTAVYVVSLDGGEPKRLSGATLVRGISAAQ